MEGLPLIFLSKYMLVLITVQCQLHEFSQSAARCLPGQCDSNDITGGEVPEHF